MKLPYSPDNLTEILKSLFLYGIYLTSDSIILMASLYDEPPARLRLLFWTLSEAGPQSVMPDDTS